MFNLGYLPGSDKTIITKAEATISAIEQSIELMDEDGLISLIIYKGHDGGMDEYRTIKLWLENNESLAEAKFVNPNSEISPELVFIQKH